MATAALPDSFTSGVDIAIDVRRDRVLILSLDGELFTLDTKTNAVVNTIRVGDTAWSMAVDSATGRVYVLVTPPSTSVDGSLVVVDIATSALIAKIDPGPGVFNSDSVVGVNPLTGCVYVAGGAIDGLTIVDARTNHVVGVLAPNAHTQALAFDLSTNRVFVTTGGELLVIDGSTNTVADAFPDCCGGPIAMHPDSGRLYALRGDEELVVVDGTTGALIKTPTVPNRPDRIVVDPTANRVYVANIYARTVSVIDAATDELVGTTVVAQTMANGIAVDPRSGRIYVVDQFGLPRIVRVLE